MHVGRGAAFADYDNDGGVDVFIVNQEGRPQLLRNDGGNKKNWIKVHVKCRKSNRTGFGTKVEIEAGGQIQAQEIGGQTSVPVTEFSRSAFRSQPRKRGCPPQSHISERYGPRNGARRCE